MTSLGSSNVSENGLFFRRFLAHPIEVCSCVASSQALARLIAGQIRCADDEYVVELGAGTGSVTQAILSSGIPAGRVIVVEIDREMTQFLRIACPGVSVLECSAFDIEQSLPQNAMGKVGAIVCGIPIALSSPGMKRRLVASMLSLLPEGRPFLVYTYRPTSPLPTKKLGLAGQRLGFTLRNFPPASVWAYRRDGEISDRGSTNAPDAGRMDVAAGDKPRNEAAQ